MSMFHIHWHNQYVTDVPGTSGAWVFWKCRCGHQKTKRCCW